MTIKLLFYAQTKENLIKVSHLYFSLVTELISLMINCYRINFEFITLSFGQQSNALFKKIEIR